MPNDQSEIDERYQPRSFRELFCILLKHKWKMLVFFTVVVVSVTALVLCTAEIYQSEATLLVRLGRESVALDPTATTGQIVPVQRSRESEILTELDILRSRKLAEKVVDLIGPDAILKNNAQETSDPTAKAPGSPTRFTQNIRTIKGGLRYLLERTGLRKRLSDHDKAVLTIMKNSEITTEKEISNTININFEAKSPHSAQYVLAELIDAYLEEHVAVHKATGSYEFFAQQSSMARDKLSQLERQFQSLQKGTSMSLVNEELKIILNRIGSIENDINREEAALNASKARAQKLIETLDGLPETVVTSTTTGLPNMAADRMRERLYELQLKEQDLLSNYDEQSRQVREIKRQIAEAKAVLQQEQRNSTQTTMGVNSAQQQTEIALLNERASISAREKTVECLKEKLTQAQAQLQSLSDKTAEMKNLHREIEIQEDNYRKYTNNLEQSRIDQALMADRISNITVVQPATFPITPIRPRKGLQLGLGILLGLSGAIALAFICEYLGSTIETPRKTGGKLGLPVLAYMPNTSENTICPIDHENEFSQDNDGALELGLDEWDIPEIVRGHYEELGQKILSSLDNSHDEPHVLAIMPLQSSEGVSTVAANLAAVLSRYSNEPVLLVDANFTCPSLHSIFHVSASVGLLDILSFGGDLTDFIWPLPIKNLSLLPAGTPNGNRFKMGDPSQIAEMLDQLKNEYRYIVIDLPPVDQVDWAVRLAGECDGVGLVVEEDNARGETVQAVKEQLLMSKANIFGIVLNKRQSSTPVLQYGHYGDPVGTAGLN